ncbi:MAG: IS21-like element helper ATPase IstB [Fermentimonas sp.]|nr:IS21-like element helper ATPase IstB [Fermentimonas sp.]
MEQIKSELVTLRLSGMAETLGMLEESRKIQELSLSDGLRLLIQGERDQRETKRYVRLLKNAAFRYQASLEEVSFDASRGLNKSQILSLATGNYIRNGESILITGATGCGKSFIATSFGYQACKQGFGVNYFSMQKLMAKIKIARIEGVMTSFFEKMAKTDLLIFDDFGIGSLDSQQQLDFMEIIEDRHGRKATIIASQMPPANWFDLFTDETIADAFMDRMIHTSHRIELKGDSLRKKR